MVLSVLSIWSPKSSVTNLKSPKQAADEPVKVSVAPVISGEDSEGAKDNVDASGVSSPIGVEQKQLAVPSGSSTEPKAKAPEPTAEPIESVHRPTRAQPRFSFRSLGFFTGEKKNAITHEQDMTERHKVGDAAKRESLSLFSRPADRRTQRNALAVQRLIVGSGSIASANPKTRPVSRAQLTRIKSELTKPKSANRLIAKLRELPIPDAPRAVDSTKPSATSKAMGSAPIHAVCLENTEADVQSKHFSKLTDQSIISSSLEALTSLFDDLHIVDLLSAPDLGLGQPGDGEGLLAGAIPTAETIIEGATKLTPQLMALGYATGQAILPSHTGVYPPTDRLSVLTYWWGLELCLPPPSLANLAQAPSIAHQVINFLSALALMYQGVREILPFVRYIGQFVDFEWAAIQKADKGRGVVCAATWIMPAAMVPRPWDFPNAPPKTIPAPVGEPVEGGDPAVPPADEVSKPQPPKDGGKSAKKGPEQVPPAGGNVSEGTQTPNGPLPTVFVTPPSVIKNIPSPTLETPAV